MLVIGDTNAGTSSGKDSGVDGRLSVLIVAARLPLPLNTGAKIRAYHVIKSLSSVFGVTLAFFYADRSEEFLFEGLTKLGIRMIPVFNPLIDRHLGMKDVMFNLFETCPVTVAKYWHSEMAEIIKTESENHDVIHCEHIHMAQYLSRETLAKTVLDSHNVESQLAQRCYLSENRIIRRWLLGWNYRKFLKYEAASFLRFDMVFAVSDSDRLEINRLGASELAVPIENGVDIEYFQPRKSAEDCSLVFVGSMDWLPNDDGMHYFMDEILPLLVARGLDPQVCIVGRAPSAALREKAARVKGVTITGTVDDVRPYIEKSSVYIVPLRFGGGTRLKILEAFAMNKAVISTSLGCEGIECADGKHLVIADSAESFADSVLMLLGDPSKRALLAENAYNLVVEKYSWRVISEKIIGNYRVLLSK